MGFKVGEDFWVGKGFSSIGVGSRIEDHHRCPN